jgi:hypothetical protein
MECQGDPCQRKIPGPPCPNLPVGASHTLGIRQGDVREHFVSLQNGFLSRVVAWTDVKFLQRYRSGTSGTGNVCRGLKCHECRCRVRRMDDKTVLASEDAVVLIFSPHGVADVSASSQAMKCAPVVPTARLLTQIASQRALVSELRTGHLGGGRCQAGICPVDFRVFRYLRYGSERTDRPFSVGFSYSFQCIDMIDAHDVSGMEYLVSKASEQVGTAGHDASFLSPQIRYRFLDGSRTCVRKVRQHRSSPFSTYRMRRQGAQASWAFG